MAVIQNGEKRQIKLRLQKIKNGAHSNWRTLKLGWRPFKIITGAILSTKIRSPGIFVYVLCHLFTSCDKRHICLHTRG